MTTYDIAESQQTSSTLQPQGNDFISEMSDDVLVIILSRLPVKDAVVTGGLSTRWRFLWRNLIHLNFDGSETLDSMSWEDCRVSGSKPYNKYINQVNSVIKSYNRPTVQNFRICFYLDNRYKEVIDEWVRFAVNKKAELLELGFRETGPKRYWIKNYDFPLIFPKRNISHNVTTVVDPVSLKQLILNKVNVNETVLLEILTNCPHLEKISIHDSSDLKHIRVGGRALKLKHFEIVYCWSVESIYLSDFDLVSFTFHGYRIRLRLTHLPKLEQVNMREGGGELFYYSDMLSQISSCDLSMIALSLRMRFPQQPGAKFVSFPLLRTVKKLRLEINGRIHNGSLHLAVILDVCPNLETFTLEPCFLTKNYTRETIDGPGYRHEHLKHLNIVGNYDDLLEFLYDFELVAYLISNAVALKKIVIDPRTKAGNVANPNDISQNAEVVQKLESLKPQGVELVFL